VAQCRHGNRKAQYMLFRQYAHAMYNLCFRMTACREDAQDIVQEAFVTAFLKIDSLNDPDSFGAWLKKIVINKTVSFLRNKNRIGFETEEDVPDWPADDCLEDEMISPEQIHEAIMELPSGSRVILNMYLIEGLKHKEIASMLGISCSTSKSQFQRAKRILYDKLKTLVYETQY